MTVLSLTENVSDRVLSPRNLFLLALLYPLIKLLHELGHALSTKVWGGEVHEMGVMLLVLMPIPYVDASAASAFRSRRRRVLVGAGGIVVELFLAALAMFAWLNMEPGILRAAAYNIMLIGGVSTVLFNGNPLLRYDGYYILADLIEIPNLGQRSTRYLGYLLQRYLLGIATVESPVTAPGEKGWFLAYGPVAFCYRIAVLVGLVLLVSSRFFIVGILIGIWGAISLLLVPVLTTGCSDDEIMAPEVGTANVRVTHLSPDAPNVDVWVDGAKVLENVPYLAVSSYLQLPAGPYLIQVTPTGETDPKVIDATVTVEGGIVRG